MSSVSFKGRKLQYAACSKAGIKLLGGFDFDVSEFQ
jgi:hypothetical protein